MNNGNSRIKNEFTIVTQFLFFSYEQFIMFGQLKKIPTRISSRTLKIIFNGSRKTRELQYQIIIFIQKETN